MMIEERECATSGRSNDLETRVFPTSEFAPSAGGGARVEQPTASAPARVILVSGGPFFSKIF